MEKGHKKMHDDEEKDGIHTVAEWEPKNACH